MLKGRRSHILLILTRESQESVIVGASGSFEPLLKVTVLDFGNGKMRLGFDGDADVRVHRLEVWGAHPRGDRPARSTGGPGAAECYDPASVTTRVPRKQATP